MWDLYPDRIAGGAFAQELSSMPAGRYQIFADIVDKDGFPWTLVGSVALTQINGKALAGDDSAWSGTAVSTQLDDFGVSQLADGGRLIWQRAKDPLETNAPINLKFPVARKG